MVMSSIRTASLVNRSASRDSGSLSATTAKIPRHTEARHHTLLEMVSRLGLEPRALALKGELCSSFNTTDPKNTLTYRPSYPLHLGPFWGLLEPVHGQKTDKCWVDADTDGLLSIHTFLEIARRLRKAMPPCFAYIAQSVVAPVRVGVRAGVNP